MTTEPDSLVFLERKNEKFDDDDDDANKRPHKVGNGSAEFKFVESDESKLFRKFLINWELTWSSQRKSSMTIKQ